MPVVHAFEYEKPKSAGKAVKLLARHGAKARVLAGGTDLVTLMLEGVERPEVVVDIKGIEKLRGITWRKNGLHLGALATFSDVLESNLVREKYPVLAEMARWVASCGIRNRATLAGNLCSAVPCCDSGPVLMAYGAVVIVKSAKSKRKIPLGEWFAGPRKTVLRKGELVTGIQVPLLGGKHAGCFVKLRRGRGEDLAQASVTVLALPNKVWRIAFGSVAPTPVRAARIEALLQGKKLTDELVGEAVKLVDGCIAPITDVRASREYRLHMTKVMLARGLKTAAERLAGKGPAYGQSVI